MSHLLVRHCPRCVTDYRPGIDRCVDCGGELVDRFEESDPDLWRRPGETRGRRPVAPAGDPRFLSPATRETGRDDPVGEGEAPPGWGPIYFAFAASDLRPLADRLASRGLLFRVITRPEARDVESPRTRFELWVREEDRAFALEDVHDLARVTPGGVEGGPATAPDADFDPRDGYRRCPACGAALVRRAPECPGCGLGLEGRDPARCDGPG